MDDPEQGGRRFRDVRAGMEGQGRRRQGRAQLLRQAGLCRTRSKLGEINAERLAKLQDFYVAKGLIQKASPVEDLYSNAFVK